eukprot:623335-Pelagomonas_calceolata.AAC.2
MGCMMDGCDSIPIRVRVPTMIDVEVHRVLAFLRVQSFNCVITAFAVAEPLTLYGENKTCTRNLSLTLAQPAQHWPSKYCLPACAMPHACLRNTCLQNKA